MTHSNQNDVSILVHGGARTMIVHIPCTKIMHVRAHLHTTSDLHVHRRAHPCTCPVSPVHHAPPSPGGRGLVHEPEHEHREHQATRRKLIFGRSRTGSS